LIMLIEKNIFISGLIISTGYGVVTLQGFLIAFISELFRICVMGFHYGLVVNLYRNETMNLLIGPLLLNPGNRVSEGASRSKKTVLLDAPIGIFFVMV